MRTSRNVVLVGIAAAALAATGGLALAKSPAFHSMTVQLPDGTMARIQYSGNVPPRVTFAARPFATGFYGPVSPFARLDQISAQMNRTMDALMYQADMLPVPPWPSQHVFSADMHSPMPASARYSMVSTSTGAGGFCMHTMRITRAGNGAPPKIVSHSYGNCHALSHATVGYAPDRSNDAIGRRMRQVNTQSSEPHTAPSLVEAAYRPLH